MNKFVLSESEFKSVKSAEDKVTEWWKSRSLKTKNIKLYKVTEIYDLKLKFVKRKGGEG